MPRDDVLWAMRKLYIEKWLISLAQSMYRIAQSCVKVIETISHGFPSLVQYQGSMFSPLLFILVLEVSAGSTV